MRHACRYFERRLQSQVQANTTLNCRQASEPLRAASHLDVAARLKAIQLVHDLVRPRQRGRGVVMSGSHCWGCMHNRKLDGGNQSLQPSPRCASPPSLCAAPRCLLRMDQGVQHNWAQSRCCKSQKPPCRKHHRHCAATTRNNSSGPCAPPSSSVRVPPTAAGGESARQ